jgi:predicted DNA-binding protein (MmcQ/YjbR family)
MEIENRVIPLPEDIMKNYQWLDECLQKQTATVKEFQPAWQAYKYLLNGKMYAYIGMDDRNGRPIITLKLEPAYSELLRGEYDDIVPGYYMSKLHWSTVYLDGSVPKELLEDMVSASYKIMLSSLTKKAQREIMENPE